MQHPDLVVDGGAIELFFRVQQRELQALPGSVEIPAVPFDLPEGQIRPGEGMLGFLVGADGESFQRIAGYEQRPFGPLELRHGHRHVQRRFA